MPWQSISSRMFIMVFRASLSLSWWTGKIILDTMWYFRSGAFGWLLIISALAQVSANPCQMCHASTYPCQGSALAICLHCLSSWLICWLLSDIHLWALVSILPPTAPLLASSCCIWHHPVGCVLRIAESVISVIQGWMWLCNTDIPLGNAKIHCILQHAILESMMFLLWFVSSLVVSFSFPFFVKLTSSLVCALTDGLTVYFSSIH